MTWEIFRKNVQERLCSQGSKQEIEMEFLSLKNGNMTITQYNTTFIEKPQFTTNYCSTEEKTVRHYIEGLPYEYRVVVHSKVTLIEDMDEARKIEKDIAVCDSSIGKGGDERKWDGFSDLIIKEEE